jgi:predicted nucleic acid-binding protein
MEGEYVVSDPVKLPFSDESDKKFFEIFMSGNAQYLITGNKNHFPSMTRIVTPSEFLESFL